MGGGKGGKSLKKRGDELGKGLSKDRNRRTAQKREKMAVVGPRTDKHVTDLEEDLGRDLRSVTHMSAVAEMLQIAEMSERKYESEKPRVVVMGSSTRRAYSEPTAAQVRRMRSLWNRLRIPRRPQWDASTTGEELQAMERQAFLDWRRELADLEEEEEMLLTPFEKNIEVWRQLWRVVERSDLIVQVVDARNPALFRSLDLENYVAEVSDRKRSLLLVNKADLLTPNQRSIWAEYFSRNNVRYLFWSALQAEEDLQGNSENSNDESESDEKIDEDVSDENADDESDENSDENADVTDVDNADDDVDESIRIYGKHELMEKIHGMVKELWPEEWTVRKIVVGMVGYPNVGKSSTINVLVDRKAVSVSATPGKTKHLQTIELDERIQLCDCPGLVFPSFVATKAEMVVNGLLPIHQLREHRAPTELVCNRVPRDVLERAFGVRLPKPDVLAGEAPDRAPYASELLQSYASARGFYTGRGIPDEARAARMVLTRFVTGTLLYAHPPPADDLEAIWVPWHDDPATRDVGLTKEMAVELERQRGRKLREDVRVDRERATYDLKVQMQVQAHTTGARHRKVRGYTRPERPYG